MGRRGCPTLFPPARCALFCGGEGGWDSTWATESSIIRYVVVVTHFNKTFWRHSGRKAFIDTDPGSLGIGASSPSTQALGIIPCLKNQAIASVILGTRVPSSTMKISTGMPSRPGEEPLCIFSSVVYTRSSVRGFNIDLAACFTLAANGSDWMYSRHSGTDLAPAAMMLDQCSCSARATFIGSVSISPYLLCKECRRRLFCTSLTNLAICCFLSCLELGVWGFQPTPISAHREASPHSCPSLSLCN